MSDNASTEPQMRSVIPYLVVDDGDAAIEFYKSAFNATEHFRMKFPDQDIVMHAQLSIGDSQIMLTEETSQLPKESRSPKTLGGSPVSIHLYCEDVDSLFNQAVAAGATVTMPLTDAFWGDRFGKLTDPFGHQWSLGQPIEEVSPEEMNRRAKELFDQK